MARDHLTLQGFLDLVPDEDHVEALFLSARWPDGAVCRWCGSVGNARRLPGCKMLFHGRDCGRATSVGAGTSRVIDRQQARLADASTASAFPLWLRLGTLDKGRRIEIPRTYPYFESRQGQRCQTVQIKESDDGTSQVGVITDVSEAFADERLK